MAGEKDKAKGSKEAAGKVTGDRRTEAEGKTDRAKGARQKARAPCEGKRPRCLSNPVACNDAITSLTVLIP